MSDRLSGIANRFDSINPRSHNLIWYSCCLISLYTPNLHITLRRYYQAISDEERQDRSGATPWQAHAQPQRQTSAISWLTGRLAYNYQQYRKCERRDESDVRHVGRRLIINHGLHSTIPNIIVVGLQLNQLTLCRNTAVVNSCAYSFIVFTFCAARLLRCRVITLYS